MSNKKRTTERSKKKTGTCITAVIVDFNGVKVVCCQNGLGVKGSHWRTAGVSVKDLSSCLCVGEKVISEPGKKLITKFKLEAMHASSCYVSGPACISYAV